MIETNANEALDIAVNQLQIAVDGIKQQRVRESKMWQKRAQELQNQINSLNSQIQEYASINAQLNQEKYELESEIEKLRSLNQNLTKQLTEKEHELSRFASINQSIKSLLDANGAPQIGYPNLDHNNYNDDLKCTVLKTPVMPSYNNKKNPPASKKPPTRSSIFLKAAKEQLSYSAFNQLINEINLYNQKSQSREETINKVKSILVPTNTKLFDEFLPMISKC